jgi:hypothetical protein
VLVRLIWFALAVLHVLPIWRVGADLAGGGDGLGSFIILLLAQAFFVLKAFDVPWLRLPYRHGTLVSLIMLGLIGHGDVAAKGIEQMPMLVPVATVFVVGVAGTCVLRRKSKTGRGWRLSLAGRPPFAVRLRLCLNQLATDLLSRTAFRRISVVSVPCCGGRAPPLNASGA